MDDEARRVFALYPVVVDSLHEEGVCAGVQVGIGNLAIAALGLEPLVVEAL